MLEEVNAVVAGSLFLGLLLNVTGSMYLLPPFWQLTLPPGTCTLPRVLLPPPPWEWVLWRPAPSSPGGGPWNTLSFCRFFKYYTCEVKPGPGPGCRGKGSGIAPESRSLDASSTAIGHSEFGTRLAVHHPHRLPVGRSWPGPGVVGTGR